MDETTLDNVILALLFACDEPLTVKRIANVLDDMPAGEVRDSMSRLESRFGAPESAIRLEQVAGGFQLCTNPRYSDHVARLYRGRRKQRLSKASMETLAIIAYRQPVTRADVENVRGVACGGVITTLMERSLIRIVGKARILGSPFLYGTTQEFLEYLGLNSLKDLPSMEDLEALLEREAASEPIEDAGETIDARGERTVLNGGFGEPTEERKPAGRAAVSGEAEDAAAAPGEETSPAPEPDGSVGSGDSGP
jgi:segregation and condensation protein B